VKGTDVLTAQQIRQAVKTLRSHRATNQQSDLTPKQWKELRESFDFFMEKDFKDSPIKDDVNELKNVITTGRLV